MGLPDFSPWTIFLYTNNYLRDFDPSCKDFPRILVLRPLGIAPVSDFFPTCPQGDRGFRPLQRSAILFRPMNPKF